MALLALAEIRNTIGEISRTTTTRKMPQARESTLSFFLSLNMVYKMYLILSDETATFFATFISSLTLARKTLTLSA